MCFEWRYARFRIAAVQSIDLLRPVGDLSGRDVPSPATGMAQPLRFRQIGLAPLQGLLRAYAIGEIAGNAPVARKPALGIKHRLAADGHEAKRTVGALDLVDEVAKRLAALHGCNVLAPFSRLQREVGSDVPAMLADRLAPVIPKGAAMLREEGEAMFPVGRPQPVGRRLGIIAEALPTVAQLAIGGLQTRAHAVERADELVKLVRSLRRTPLQSERRRRTAQVVAAEKPCCRGEMTR